MKLASWHPTLYCESNVCLFVFASTKSICKYSSVCLPYASFIQPIPAKMNIWFFFFYTRCPPYCSWRQKSFLLSQLYTYTYTRDIFYDRSLTFHRATQHKYARISGGMLHTHKKDIWKFFFFFGMPKTVFADIYLHIYSTLHIIFGGDERRQEWRQNWNFQYMRVFYALSLCGKILISIRIIIKIMRIFPFMIESGCGGSGAQYCALGMLKERNHKLSARVFNITNFLNVNKTHSRYCHVKLVKMNFYIKKKKVPLIKSAPTNYR